MKRVLFLCSSNAACSQMAEAFARAMAPPDTQITSAGIEAAAVHPMTRAVMAEVDIDISDHRAKSLRDLSSLEFDVVVTLCAQSARQCPVLPGNPEQVHWKLTDPQTVIGDETAALSAFRRSRDEIQHLVRDFLDKGYLSALVDAKRCEALILDSISDGIIAHDMQRRIFYFNRAAEEITGYRRGDVLNRDCHDVFPGSFCGARCLFPGGSEPPDSPRTREFDLVTKDGEKRHVRSQLVPMVDSEKGQVGVIVSFTDLTRERRLARRVGEIQSFAGIIGRDNAMLDVFDLIGDVADTNVPVLVQGESGTGKELVAAAIHNESTRANKLFVPVNCGALPQTLLESELFGHVKGAFTGAIRDKKGRFELADGGTIFLDEIGDISPAMQVRLLRVLQEGTFERVGSETTLKVNVRVISATNRNLLEEIANGHFREDLYYRLNVVPIFLPTLRERRNDIPLLIAHILKGVLSDLGRSGVTMSDEARDIMLAYDWPGNVRELQNWVQFALVKCRGDVILPTHLPPVQSGRPRAVRRRRKLDVETVRSALSETEGNKVEAARLLGVSRATLYRFLGEVGGVE
jgi:sigma-54 dependent transcriptional regulator, acetoin dehydrogenase operon transcriptional activator AcoR